MVGLEGEDDKGSNWLKLNNMCVFVWSSLRFFIKISINRYLSGGGICLRRTVEGVLAWDRRGMCSLSLCIVLTGDLKAAGPGCSTSAGANFGRFRS